jgi:plasmid stabilization system protein ParE
MKYEVVVSDPAQADIEQAYQWLLERTPLNAPKWHDGLLDKLQTLEANPLRCPLAPEDNESSEEVRQLIYGDKRHNYRILFSIRRGMVWILHVRHGARNR